MTRLLQQEDSYWRQRAKAHWFKDGDRNTKYFHASATARKKVNKILSLETDHGVIVTDSAGMSDVARNYFVDLFQQKQSNTAPVVTIVRSAISHDDNIQLIASFMK